MVSLGTRDVTLITNPFGNTGPTNLNWPAKRSDEIMYYSIDINDWLAETNDALDAPPVVYVRKDFRTAALAIGGNDVSITGNSLNVNSSTPGSNGVDNFQINSENILVGGLILSIAGYTNSDVLIDIVAYNAFATGHWVSVTIAYGLPGKTYVIDLVVTTVQGRVLDLRVYLPIVENNYNLVLPVTSFQFTIGGEDITIHGSQIIPGQSRPLPNALSDNQGIFLTDNAGTILMSNGP